MSKFAQKVEKNRTSIAAVAFVLFALLCLPVSAGGGIKIALRADSGKYLARCNNCIPGGAKPDNGFVHIDNYEKGAYAQWYIEYIDKGTYALRSVDSGHYFSRCNNCVPGGAYSDNASVHLKDARGRYAQWIIQKLPNGKYALRCSDSGMYLARCNNCVPKGAYPDSAFVHVKDPKRAGYAQWDIVFVP